MAKGIDLGTLQQEYEQAKRQHNTNIKALERAQLTYEASKLKAKEAHEALKDASRAVLE